MASDLSPSLSTAVTAVLILLFRPACRVGTSKPRLPRLGIVRSTTATAHAHGSRSTGTVSLGPRPMGGARLVSR